MDLQTVVIVMGAAWLATCIIFGFIITSVYAELHDQVKHTRYGLRSLATALGFEYSRSWHTNEVLINYPWSHNDRLPASRADVEKFFAEHEERLNAVYKHLGIKVEKKTTPMVAAKSEVVVSKAAKN